MPKPDELPVSHPPVESPRPPQHFDWPQPAKEQSFLLAVAHLSGGAAEGIRRRCGCQVRAGVDGVRVLSAQEFRRGAAEPSCCFAIPANEHASGPSPAHRERSSALLLDFSGTLSFGLIDLLLGGAGNETPPRSRSLTTVQRRLLEMIAASIAGACGELDGQAAHEGAVVVVRVDVQAGQARGVLRMGAPLAAVRALGHRLEQGRESWVQVELPEASANRGDLERLGVGDVIDTELPIDAAVRVMFRGQCTFLGRLGLSNGHRAVRLVQKAPPSANPPPQA